MISIQMPDVFREKLMLFLSKCSEPLQTILGQDYPSKIAARGEKNVGRTMQIFHCLRRI